MFTLTLSGFHIFSIGLTPSAIVNNTLTWTVINKDLLKAHVKCHLNKGHLCFFVYTDIFGQQYESCCAWKQIGEHYENRFTFVFLCTSLLKRAFPALWRRLTIPTVCTVDRST